MKLSGQKQNKSIQSQILTIQIGYPLNGNLYRKPYTTIQRYKLHNVQLFYSAHPIFSLTRGKMHTTYVL